MRLENDVQVQVARRAAVRAGAALAGEPQALPVGRAAGNTGADRPAVEAQLALRAARRLLEAEAHRHFVILAGELHAAAGTAAAHAGTAEDAHRLEQVGQVDVAQVVPHSSRPAAAEAVEPVGRRAEVLARAVAAQAVVRGALFLVAQRLVRLGDFLELLLGVGLLGDVRVVLARQPAVGLLDLLVGRAALDAEALVVVLVLHAPLYWGA